MAISKINYKSKIEAMFKANNTKETWLGLKRMIGYTEKKTTLHTDNINDYVNNLNSFYARFENSNPNIEHSSPLENTLFEKTNTDEPVIVSESEVKCEFKRVNGRKACGPDGIKGKVLRMCFEQLGFIFSFIMNESFSQHSLPLVWKQSEIIPVPKKENVTELNDLRPIALTSVVMKCMEKMILRKLRAVFDPIQDPFQFAYRQKRGVEDAIIVFLDNIYKHIDKPKTYCRILYVDFSSAFNTIQPSILLEKLIDLDVTSYLSLWINSFLTERSRYFRYGNVQSNPIITNAGAPPPPPPQVVYCPRSFSRCIQMIVRLMTAIPNCLSLLMTHKS